MYKTILVLFTLFFLVFGNVGCPNGSDDACEDVSCGSNGICNPDSGACDCDAGYRGAFCDECASGYHDEAGACVVDACQGDGGCDDGLACNGPEVCNGGQCQQGFGVQCEDNAHCEEPNGDCLCDEGYQEVGGICLEDVDPIEIIGSWADDWGFSHEISETTWDNAGSVFHISQYDNLAGYLVAQNDAANAWNPDLWSRFDWTWHADQLHYCQLAYDAASEADALAATGADRADLLAGCGGFAWSRLSEPLAINGSWVDDYAYSHVIAQTTWTNGDSVFHVSQFDNQAEYLVAQNDAANAWNPDLWSRFDWTWDVDQLYYCQIAYDAASESDALAATGADRADLATGCGGFSWSQLNPG
jgi:hypothetical protein